MHTITKENPSLTLNKSTQKVQIHFRRGVRFGRFTRDKRLMWWIQISMIILSILYGIWILHIENKLNVSRCFILYENNYRLSTKYKNEFIFIGYVQNLLFSNKWIDHWKFVNSFDINYYEQFLSFVLFGEIL